MPVRILATADIHIGRRPTRLPTVDLAERASAAHMWEEIVLRAITEKVDAVMLSGDIVDNASRFYEATGPLERGIYRLADAGIPSYAVAGNHDWDVFPRILEQLDTPLFHFLGQEGSWEEAVLERDGQQLLRIVGWSFPARYMRQSPLLDFHLDSDSDVPTIGLLHADVDIPTSDYAPVGLSELQARDVALWVLGHVHKPQHWASESGADVLYPGSPQALNPKEPGQHGPWLIELEGKHSVNCQQIPMSLVRYDEYDVDLEEATTSEDFDAAVNNTISQALENVVGRDEPTKLLSLRMNFVGSTPLCGKIASLAEGLGDLERSRDGVESQIEEHTNRTRPAIDLAELADRNDPAGVLARTLLALEQDEPDETLATLISEATARLQEVHRAPAFVALVDRDPAPDRDRSQQILIEQGRQLLEALRAQLPQRQESSDE
jgi:exonuclease SbcD